VRDVDQTRREAETLGLSVKGKELLGLTRALAGVLESDAEPLALVKTFVAETYVGLAAVTRAHVCHVWFKLTGFGLLFKDEAAIAKSSSTARLALGDLTSSDWQQRTSGVLSSSWFVTLVGSTKADTLQFTLAGENTSESVARFRRVLEQGGSRPATAGQQGDLAEQLAKLAGLHASGALTEAEFQTAKQRILKAD
jgi:hypothetical protein